MSLPIIVRNRAEKDIRVAEQRYEEKVPGLGGDFARMLDHCFGLISRHPKIFPVVYRGARMGLVKRFPYLVIYKDFEDFVSIVAVMDGSRNPKRWKKRLQ